MASKKEIKENLNAALKKIGSENTMEFPKHMSLHISHNPHKEYYETVKQYLDNYEQFRDCISKEDLEICIKENELWELHWYPNTPIVFHKIHSYSLKRCLELAKNIA